jgi:hypothetical protein
MPMQIRDDFGLEEVWAERPVQDVLPLETIQSALYGAVRFAESTLGGAGVRLSRLICTPDARRWTLAFGERFFLVEVVDDGFSVRSVPRSATV